MSPPSRKEVRKQKKQRDRKRRIAKAQARSREPFPPAPHIPEFPRRAPELEPDPDTLSPIDGCWKEYSNADGPERLQMTREKLTTVSRDDDWFNALFPEAITELETKLPDSQYVAFLEQLRDEYPDVFELAADWHTRSMVFHYVSEGRLEEIDRAAEFLAARMASISDPFFSLISMVRLAGCAEAAQKLIDAAMPLIENSDLIDWAVDELIELAMHGPFQTCIEAGATEEAIEAAFRKSLTLGVKDTRDNRAIQRKRIALMAGTSKKAWNRDELLAAGRNASQMFPDLLWDATRWLCRERGFQPIVADELRRILVETINHMDCDPNVLLRGLKRSDFEPVLVRYLGFLSLSRFHAPAAVVAMGHFYDFLHAHDLVDSRICSTAHDVCYVLWRAIKNAMAQGWEKCRFLESYQSIATTRG